MRNEKRHITLHSRLRGTRILLYLMLLAVFAGFIPNAAAQVSFRAASSASVQNGTSAISFVGSGARVFANSGNLTPPLPAHVANDLLLCLVESTDNVAHSVSTAGWNPLYSHSSASGKHRASAFWKIATSSVDTNPTIAHPSGGGIVARCAAFRGVSTTNPFDVAYAPSSAATLTSPTGVTVQSGSLTTVTNNAWVLFAAHIADNPNGLSMATTSGLTWTPSFYSSANNGLQEAVGLFHAGPIPTGTVGPLVANMTSENGESTGVVLALRPNSSAGNALSISVPPGTAEDDVMIASIAVSPNTVSVTAPSGWTLVRQVIQSAATTSTLQTYYKVASGAEPASYTWTFSGGAHAGAAGGIAAFSGADPNVPIDSEMGTATASGTSHAAASLTTTQTNSMLVTVHAYASSSAWAPPAGMSEAVDVASRTPSNAAGISMEINYEARPSIGTIGARTATATLNADRGATQSLVLKPAGGLTCFSDEFNRPNGAPGSNWAVGNESGGFNPQIVNNRLRLTPASGQVSTYATLQRLFPGAGNKIVVEFLHYAYGGTTGADGIGIILSDASQPPIAGAFGGSMGYAPKRVDQGGDTTHPGFVGGWLGVALDEWGNFSSNTEGRSGGDAPGLVADSVSLRGSGTGYAGYAYLTGASVTPGIDNAASSSPAPGHKYRITVDHSDGESAWTSVERDTTGVGDAYVTIIPAFDAKAQPGQSAVPVNWFLSFTGATGMATNIHEIDGLKICSPSQQTFSLHHIELHHSGTSCGVATVTVKACANVECTGLYPGTVTVDLNNVGTWSADPVTFSGGSTDVTLTVASGTVTLGGSATSPAATNATTCFNGADETCVLTFISACFDAAETGAGRSTPIYTKLAGTAFSLDVLAVSGTSINTGYTGTVAVDLVDPTAASGNCTDTIAGLTTPVNVTFSSGNNGRRPVTLSYGNAAKNVKVRMISGARSICSSDNFAIRPRQFTMSTSTALNPAANSVAAGNGFNLTATAVSTTGATTTRYTGGPGLNTSSIVDHNGTTAGTLTGALPIVTAASAGVSSGSFSYQDVGTITLPANAVTDTSFTAVDQQTGMVGTVNHGATGDCVASGTLTSRTSNTLAGGKYGCSVGSSALGPLGRFRPAQYNVTAALTAACNGFTYMSQPALGIALSVSALSATGASLPRYTSTGNFGGLCASGGSCLATLNVTGVNNGTVFSPLNNRLTPDLPAFAWTTGAYNAAGNYSFDRLANPDGPYDNFRLNIAVTDIDGVLITELNGADVSPAAATVQSPTTSIRFGRLKLFNAHGSERLNLPMRIQTEFWNNPGFVLNTLDNCTGVNDANVSLQTYRGGVTGINTPHGNVDTGGGTLFAGGVGELKLDKPSPALTASGSVDLCVDLGVDVPQTCTATTSANMPWLQGNWRGATFDDDPAARATFGVSRGGPVIYLREIH